MLKNYKKTNLESFLRAAYAQVPGGSCKIRKKQRAKKLLQKQIFVKFILHFNRFPIKKWQISAEQPKNWKAQKD